MSSLTLGCGGSGAATGAGAGADAGAVGVCVLAGLTSHASSSKPPLASLAGAEVRGVALASAGASLDAGLSILCLKAFSSTTSFVCTAGAGLPLRVLFLSAPPGPENSPPSPAAPFSEGPLRSYLLSRYFMTRNMSPSFRGVVERVYSG